MHTAYAMNAATVDIFKGDVKEKKRCGGKFAGCVIGIIFFSNNRNDKQTFMHEEYKTNPISVRLGLK